MSAYRHGRGGVGGKAQRAAGHQTRRLRGRTRSGAIKVLLENGGNVNQADNTNCTPVHVASEKGHTAAIEILLKAGANIHKPDNDGTPPVWMAAAYGHTGALHTLLRAGANARTAEYKGFPTLHIAAVDGHLPVVRILAEIWPLDWRPWRVFLLGGGAASELQDYLAPPLNRSTRNFLPRLYSKPDMVKEIWTYLHKPRYVDVGQVDRQGRTAAQVATAHGNYGVAALLHEAAWVGEESSEDEEAGDGE